VLVRTRSTQNVRHLGLSINCVVQAQWQTGREFARPYSRGIRIKASDIKEERTYDNEFM
jgi:hypothetical protein